jgi:putative FmdB family regulatory protein
MTYEYTCLSCEERWDARYPVDDRDIPLSEPCPKCGVEGQVKRVPTAVRVSYEGFQSPITRAGGEWNDVLKSIKKGAGKKSTIETK